MADQGNVIQLAGEFTDDDMERFYPADDMLNRGSLMLLDFSNPLSGVTGVPAGSAILNNLAWDIAQKMIPSGTQSSLSPQVINTLTLGSASFAELTPKKGLHVIVSKTNDISSGNELIINFGYNTLLRNYIIDNPTHEFYFSAWYKKTRIADTTVSADFFMAESTTAFKFIFDAINGKPNSTQQPANAVGSFMSPGSDPNTVNTLFRAVGAKNYWGTVNANRNLIAFYFKFTSAGPWGGFEVNKQSSNCLYRLYMEDLTVAGRTFAEAQAEDKAAFDVAFGAGGKFEGDTLTAVGTLP